MQPGYVVFSINFDRTATKEDREDLIENFRKILNECKRDNVVNSFYVKGDGIDE